MKKSFVVLGGNFLFLSRELRVKKKYLRGQISQKHKRDRDKLLYTNLYHKHRLLYTEKKTTDTNNTKLKRPDAFKLDEFYRFVTDDASFVPCFAQVAHTSLGDGFRSGFDVGHSKRTGFNKADVPGGTRGEMLFIFR